MSKLYLYIKSCLLLKRICIPCNLHNPFIVKLQYMGSARE